MKLKLTFVVEVVFLVIVFFLVNIRSLIVWNMFPETGDLYGEAWREVFIWLMALLMMFYLLRERELIEKYLTIWLKNPLLLAFVLFSLVSVLWSHSWTVTLHRSLTFLFATLAAVFFGLGYTRSEFLRILRWVGGVVILSSLMLALAVPNLGTDLNPGYEGAWRGIFWHKNQVGQYPASFKRHFSS